MTTGSREPVVRGVPISAHESVITVACVAAAVAVVAVVLLLLLLLLSPVWKHKRRAERPRVFCFWIVFGSICCTLGKKRLKTLNLH